MTIKVEQEVLLRVLDSRYSSSSSPSSVPIQAPIQVDDEFLLVDFRRKPLRRSSSDDCASPSHVEKLRDAPYNNEELYDDDETSIFTLSTASVSSDDSSSTSSEIERRVSFANELVTDEWTRPYTPKELIPTLFYSMEETSRFRQEYRLERKLLSGDLDCAIESSSSDYDPSCSILPPPLPSLQEPPSSNFRGSSSYCLPVPNAIRHRISRVVVLHNDKLETFFDGDDDNNNSQDSNRIDEAATAPQEAPSTPSLPSPNSFFDNDSFWSGSITWY